MTAPGNDHETNDEAHRQLVRALTVERIRLYRPDQSSDARRAARRPGEPPVRVPLAQPPSTTAPHSGSTRSGRHS